jgi:hypothetical protein
LLDSTSNGNLLRGVNDSCGIYYPNHNFTGNDTARFLICQNNPFYCDTTILIFQVNGYINRSYVLASIQMDSTYSKCISFDDLYGSISSASIGITPQNGTATLISDTCIQYIPTSSFSGIDTIMIYACDSIVPVKCDTVYFIITVKPFYSTHYVYAYITPDSTYSSCVGFDELRPPYTSCNLYYNTSHSFSLLSTDTCLQYIPAVGFIGNDTLTIIACKSGTPLRCDTIKYIINVDQSNAIKINEENLVVFGVNPNPFDHEVLIQYYLYNNCRMDIELLDVNGKKMITTFIEGKKGINYGKISGEGIPKGQYIMILRVGNEVYSKKIVKQ